MMGEPITKELRDALDRMWPNPELLEIADRIDAEHKRRLDDSRRNTNRALVRYLRGVLTDYDRGIKRVRKGVAVEVVRCRDCMYARCMDDRFVCTVRPLTPHLVDADEYCSRGVRAEADE
jgi:hypothetical protein